MTFQTRYSRPKSGTLHFGEELSRTKQAHKDECDVNRIVAKAAKTGFFPQPPPAEYADLSDAVDYREALHIAQRAQDQFLALPAKVRSRFGNDPAAFLEFATDPDNGEEMIKMGLATRRFVPDETEPPAPAPQPRTQPKGRQTPKTPDSGEGDEK